jgi:hypothetical protein
LSGIFISYRREDSEDSTRAIYESLVPKFGKERLFLDVEAIKPGSDFRDAIEESLGSCGVFLAVIGPTWLNIRPDNDPNGPRRLDHPTDYVRQEVAAALKKGHALQVIPVLVRGASMPAAEELPEELKDLAYRNGLNMNNLDWDGNVAKLIDAMRPHVGEPAQQRQSTTSTPPSTAERRPAATSPPATKSVNKGLIIGGIVSLVVIAAALYAVFGRAPATTLAVTIVRNPRLTSFSGPINIFIDDQQVGQIRSNSGGSTPLQFHVPAGEHTFKFSDPQSQSNCSGTFSVNANQTKFIPRVRDGVTACTLDTALGGS